MRLFFNRWEAVSAADILGGVFIAQRHLLQSLRSQILSGTGLTPELAEILFELHLAGGNLSSSEYADEDGFVPLRDLRNALGYTPGLLSRRIGWLCQHGWVEAKRAAPSIALGLHGNCQKARITEAGREKIAPLWEKADRLAQGWLAGISLSDLGAHYRVNERISDQLRAPHFLADKRNAPDQGGPGETSGAGVTDQKSGAESKAGGPSSVEPPAKPDSPE